MCKRKVCNTLKILQYVKRTQEPGKKIVHKSINHKILCTKITCTNILLQRMIHTKNRREGIQKTYRARKFHLQNFVQENRACENLLLHNIIIIAKKKDPVDTNL